MGKPTKLDATVQARIVSAIEQGCDYELAAQYGGIHYDTFNRWMKRGKRELSGVCYEFYEAIKGAEGRSAVKWLALIEKAAQGGQWQAAAWKLERRYPQKYGRTVHEVQGKDGNEITFKVVYGNRDTDKPPTTS